MPRSPHSQILIFIALTLSLGLGAAALKNGFRISEDGLRLSRNFYAVDPGNLYRSAQLTPQELRKVISEYGIKTIVNLRGARPGFRWYDDEKAIAESLNARLVDISMTTDSIPIKEELITLLDVYEKAPRPILIHCQSGSDRTGEASAIYLMENLHQSKEEALKMLSLKYWHSSFLVPSKLYFLNLYQNETWARTVFNHCDKKYLYADRRGCWRYKYKKLNSPYEVVDGGPNPSGQP